MLIQRHAHFWFSRKGSENSVNTTFLYDFSRKISLISYSLNWPTFIVSLFLLLEILGNMRTVIVCLSDFDVKNCDINPSFSSTLFSYMTKKLWQNFEYLENKKNFGEAKSIFHLFQRASICQENASDLRLHL